MKIIPCERELSIYNKKEFIHIVDKSHLAVLRKMNLEILNYKKKKMNLKNFFLVNNLKKFNFIIHNFQSI